MATIVPFNRRTRSSSCSPCVTPTRSPRPARTAESEVNHRGAKRRVEYPTNGACKNDSPAKRLRRSPVKSPSKRLATRSFYSGTKAAYLNPLDRKQLAQIRQKNGSPVAPAPSTAEGKKPASAVRRKPLAAKGTRRGGSQDKKMPAMRSPSPAVMRTHVRDILPGSTNSPVKNSLDPPVDSPSRNQRKFFKSKRRVQASSQPVIVTKKGLEVKYKPKGVMRKAGVNAKVKPALNNLSSKLAVNKKQSNMDSIERSSPEIFTTVAVVHPTPDFSRSNGLTTSDSGGTPHLKEKVRTPKTRTPIHSSKNPNSQELFSVSDWDLDEGSADEALAASAATPEDLDSSCDLLSMFTDSGNVSYQSPPVLGDTTQTDDGVSNCSTAGESVGIVSELSQSASPTSVADTESSFERDANIYSIFKTRQNPQVNNGKTRWQYKSVEGRTRQQRMVEKDGKEQMTLDFGQKLKGAVQCPGCGMTYSHGDPTDETIHRKFHKKLLATLKFPEWKKENVLQEFEDGSRIVVIMGDQRLAMKKVLAVKEIVDQDLGFVVDSSGIKRTSKVFMFVSEDERVVGLCITEHIRKAYRVIAGTDTNIAVRSEPLCCDTKPERARCGINRIWVLCSERRCGVASKLLDCVRANFLLGFPLERDDLAFTDPTPDGRSFSARYIGRENFLVYKHSP